MDKDRHRKRSHHQNYRQALLGNPQHRGSTTGGSDKLLDYRTVSSDYADRPSHSFTPRSSSATGALSFSDYEYAPAGQYSPQQTHGPPSAYQVDEGQLSRRSDYDSPYLTSLNYDINQESQALPRSRENITNLSDPRHRQSVPIEGLSNQFDSQSYYGLGQLPPSNSLGTQVPASFQPSSAYAAAGDLGQVGFQPAFSDPNFIQSPSYGAQQPQIRSQPQMQSSETNSERHANRLRLIKQTNSHSLHGRLLEARASLLKLTQWLLDNIEPLGESGLTQDVVMETREWRLQHQERLRFWSDIHNCWLVFLQKQFDVSQSVRSTKSSRSSNANMLSRSMLEELGDEVVRISDRLEAFGLVDYEMGFQERELITLIQQCLDSLNGD